MKISSWTHPGFDEASLDILRFQVRIPYLENIEDDLELD